MCFAVVVALLLLLGHLVMLMLRGQRGELWERMVSVSLLVC